MYYWIITWIVEKDVRKMVIIGPKLTESEANRFGLEKFEGEFEVFGLPTRDKAKATSMIKAKILDRTGNLEEALRRARHSPPSEAHLVQKKEV